MALTSTEQLFIERPWYKCFLHNDNLTYFRAAASFFWMGGIKTKNTPPPPPFFYHPKFYLWFFPCFCCYHPSKHSSSWRCLEDVFKTSWSRRICSLSLTSSEDVFTSWSRPIHSSWLYVFKTPSRRFQDVFKTSSRGFQDVFKTSCQDVFKTSSRRFQDIFKTSCKDFFKTLSRRIIKLYCSC